MGVPSSSRFRNAAAAVGGDGVDNGAEEVAVDVEGIRLFRAGVDTPDTNDPRERSGWVPADWTEMSPRALRAADMGSTAK